MVRQWIFNHPQKRKEYSDRYYKNHSKECSARSMLWQKNNPENVRLIQRRCRKKMSLIPRVNLDKRMSSAVRNVLRSKKRGRSWQILIGCTTEDLRRHLESLFTEGMTWDVFMRGEIHIDHKTPLSSFHYKNTDDSDFKEAWKLENLQPLWAHDNQVKYNKTMAEWKGKT